MKGHFRSPRLVGLMLGVVAALLSEGLVVAALASPDGGRAPRESDEISVRITDEGIDPPDAVAGRVGATVVWRNESSLARVVTEPLFDLYDSGRIDPGSDFSYAPLLAGTFDYVVEPFPSLGLEYLQTEGTLGIPVSFHPVGGERPHPTYRVRWAPKSPPDGWTGDVGFGGLAFDVQRGTFSYGNPNNPYVGKWKRWYRGTSRTSDLVVIEDCDGLSHRVRVRVRDIESGAQSKWSPPNGIGCIE